MPDAMSRFTLISSTSLPGETFGKEPSAFLFHELPDQKGDARGRGAPVSQAFTRTRRDLGVDEVIAGARQSRIDFHSFRRWFIRKGVEALERGATGFIAWTIADVVGHSKKRWTAADDDGNLSREGKPRGTSSLRRGGSVAHVGGCHSPSKIDTDCLFAAWQMISACLTLEAIIFGAKMKISKISIFPLLTLVLVACAKSPDSI